MRAYTEVYREKCTHYTNLTFHFFICPFQPQPSLRTLARPGVENGTIHKFGIVPVSDGDSWAYLSMNLGQDALETTDGGCCHVGHQLLFTTLSTLIGSDNRLTIAALLLIHA